MAVAYGFKPEAAGTFILVKPTDDYLANMMLLVAALGGSGAVSCPWSVTTTTTRSGTYIGSSIFNRAAHTALAFLES